MWVLSPIHWGSRKVKWKFLPPSTKDVNWTYIRFSEEAQGVFWTSYVRSIYNLCPGGRCKKSRGLVRTPANIYHVENYYCKTLHLRCWQGPWLRLWIGRVKSFTKEKELDFWLFSSEMNLFEVIVSFLYLNILSLE